MLHNVYSCFYNSRVKQLCKMTVPQACVFKYAFYPAKIDTFGWV